MIVALPSKPSRPDLRPGVAAAVIESPAVALHPIQAQLRTQMMHAGEALIRRFLSDLDSNIQALLADARHAAETRAALDLGQTLTMQRASIERGFMLALKHRFDPLRVRVTEGIVDLERLCLLPTEDMEEHIVLGHLAQQAEERAGEDGRQLVSRLKWASRELGLPALGGALTADTLPSCFAQAMHHAELSAGERLLTLRIVESHAIKFWPELVRTALSLLDQLGLRHARSAAGGRDGLPGQDIAPGISAATAQVLRETLASPAAASDAPLAQALLQAIAPPFGGSSAGLITALTGAWMDGLVTAPELPAAFVADLESLRLVVIKAALCDPSFFTQARHPVRSAIEELARQAAFVGLQGYSLGPLRQQLREVAGRINIHGQFAADALCMLPPLDPDLAGCFRQQMQKDQSARREALLHSVRTLAMREIDARTLDVNLPGAARAALARGFLPLLCTLMLRHGSAAPRTRQARQLLERFVDSFALCIAAVERRAVLAELRSIFAEVGLPEPHAAQVCTELETVYAELAEEAQASFALARSVSAERATSSIAVGTSVAIPLEPVSVPSAAPTPMPVPPTVPSWTPVLAHNESQPEDCSERFAEQLLRVGQWFRVRDYRIGDDRWLALASVHREHDRVSFSGFDGQTVLAMRASQFVDDLASGLAEPLNPSPALQSALQGLRARVLKAADRLRGFG